MKLFPCLALIPLNKNISFAFYMKLKIEKLKKHLVVAGIEPSSANQGLQHGRLDNHLARQEIKKNRPEKNVVK